MVRGATKRSSRVEERNRALRNSEKCLPPRTNICPWSPRTSPEILDRRDEDLNRQSSLQSRQHPADDLEHGNADGTHD